MLEYWQMLPIGVVIASIAMFFGLGGGVLWMPVLLMSTDLEPKGAVVCTIVIQFFGQLSATHSNNQAGLIDWRLVCLLMAFGIPAVIFGVLFSFLLHPVWIELVLGLTIFFIAYVFLRGDDFFVTGSDQADLEAARRGRMITMFGSVLTGFLGVGVGDWLVPFFNMRCKLAMVRSVATSIALMMILSSTALGVHILFGHTIEWRVAIPGTLGVLLGAQVGSRLLRRVPETHFKEFFVLMLVFIATHVTFNAL
ncbi:MAG: sulfite exporter TauE/SafE family protein [Candidatus Electrothrix aestuarii]|uniref:Probable membrane transporter protein n=1 Tax=Candidatus Electrothrix aestuarii TaxID=3062594 RepID=A0AAU8LU95_9BACT|nr:sulfite exporter TauE/SafE family protein [Candidatus Electrothrix aestuarii]